MSLKRSNMLKTAGLCGLLATFIFFLCIIFSVNLSPWFSWTENWLSEIAGSFGDRPIWAARGVPSITWNLGIMLTGAIGLLFTIAVQKSRIFKTNWGNLTIFILFIDMSALCGIGIFPITVGDIHILTSMVVFVLIPIILFFIGYELRDLFGEKWWWLANIFCFISICSVFIFLFNGSKAVAEMIALSSLFIFVLILSFKLLKIGNSSEKTINFSY